MKAITKALGLEGTKVGNRLAGLPPLCPRCGRAEVNDPWRYKWIRAFLCFFFAPLLMLAMAGPLARDHQRTQWIPTQAEVSKSTLEEDGPTRLGRVDLRYEIDGREFSVSLRREPGAEPVRTKEDIARERRFVRRNAVGKTVSVFVNPEQPSEARFGPAPRSMFALIFILFAIGGVAACDDVGELLWPRTVHTDCDLAPQRSGVSLDHRRALSDPQWLGPRSNLTFLLLCGVGVLALAKGDATSPWLGVVAGSSLLFGVFLVRTLGELAYYFRWRKVELWLEEPHSFQPGAERQARLSGVPRGVEFSVELRGEERYYPDDDDETEELWGWSSEVIHDGEVLATERAGSETLVRFRLPADAPRPCREDGETRERWVLRASQGKRAALFELDFSPAEPPTPLEVGRLGAPKIGSTRERAEALRQEELFLPLRPSWVELDRPLSMVFHDRKLLANGGVTWGYVVQANQKLYASGSSDHPAVVVFAGNDAVTPDQLRDVSRRLFATKEEPVDRLSQLLADEQTDFLWYPAPSWLGGRAEIYFSTFLIFRRHLPEGVLACNLVPLLVAPGKTRAVAILPEAYWSEELRAWWLAQA